MSKRGLFLFYTANTIARFNASNKKNHIGKYCGGAAGFIFRIGGRGLIDKQWVCRYSEYMQCIRRTTAVNKERVSGMKCIILAGGHGERLWPLSRKNYPKQFIEIQKNHSMFQETVSRNLPFCDEFIIITGAEYRFIVESQMKAFQGTPYRCVYEEASKGTLNAVTLACLDLQPSEYVFMVVSDHVIYSRPETSSDEMDYKDCVMKAKEYAREGFISLFTLRETVINPRFGYILGLAGDGSMREFVEKPDADRIAAIDLRKEAVYRNLGMLLFRVDTFLNEFSKAEPENFARVRYVHSLRQVSGADLSYSIEDSHKTYDLWEAVSGRDATTNYAYYTREAETILESPSIAKGVLEKTKRLKAVKGVFLWSQIDNLEDLPQTDFPNRGKVIKENCYRSVVINNSESQSVVVNGLDNIIVANTPDAVYIGRYGRSSEVKQIIEKHRELRESAEHGTVFYRPWGSYEQLVEEENYRIRRVFLPVGSSIPSHSHLQRSENLTILQGEARITRDGVTQVYHVKDNIDVPVGCEHSISTAGEETLVFVETAVGEVVHGQDLVVQEEVRPDTDTLVAEPLVRLLPAFKDYLWGGTKLRDVYGMKCDYDIIAEGWMMSAHPAGQSIVGSGCCRGLHFGDYVRGIGKEALGWKCSPLQNFPMLVKFIDARQNLSIQVHPDDDYALERENEYGKNEMWYVMAAEPGAGLYVGFNRDVTREEVARRIADDTIEEILNFYPTKPGDVFYIPAGTVHAIGAGNLICEIQQSSNCTYRLYDYNRRDKYGNTRELHLEKALDVLNFNRYVPADLGGSRLDEGTVIARCKYFEATVYDVKNETRIPMDDSKFTSVICMQGHGRLSFCGMSLDVKAGDSVFVPARDGILSADGEMTLILSHV